MGHTKRGEPLKVLIGNHKMMNLITATSVPISNASWVSARTTLLSLFILLTQTSNLSNGLYLLSLGCWYITLEFPTIQVKYNP